MTNDNEEAEIQSYIKELLEDFIAEYEELEQKCLINEESLNNLNLRLVEISDKGDSNYDFFSPSGKSINVEREKLNVMLNMEKLNIINCQKQCSILLRKIERINTISKYIQSICMEDKEKHTLGMENNYIIDNLGLQILETQENERTRIASDLHDSTVQNLTNLVHKTELCLKLLDIDVLRAKLELQTMNQTIRNTINDMRAIIYDLRPMSIDDLGLVITIDRYLNKLAKENESIKFEFSNENDEINIKTVISITLFRIVQEACNNALKHAHADKVIIHLQYNIDYILLTVVDNGVGFDYTTDLYGNYDDNDMRFGLSIMKERAYLLSGKINIDSEINMGTKISVTVPL